MTQVNANANPQASADFNRAIDKIRDEMARKGTTYVRVVGEYLTEHLRRHPEHAAAILEKDRDIAGSLHKMRSEAEKRKEGGVAVLDDETAFGIVLEYYGIQAAPAARTAAKPQAPADDPDLDLDSLLGGI